MNTQIQALADQAEDYADGIVDQGGEFHEAYTQKLAELILLRATDIVYDMLDDNTGAEVVVAVKEHFGVE